MLLLALVLAGCGGAGAEGAISVGLGEDDYVLEGPTANVGFDARVTETLISLTPEYQLEPALAERWEFRPPNTWRFVLRRGVRFHDGQPFNASTAKAGLFDRVAAFGGGTIHAGAESAVVVDEFTVDFTPAQPNLRVPEQIVHPYYGAIAPRSEPGTKPVGTGPFRVREYVPEVRLVVERNGDYWGDKAKASEITFRFLPDPEVRRLALEAGDIDVATELRASDAKELRDRGVKTMTSPVGSYDALYANIRRPGGILGELAVRQAVAHAIDRRSIVEKVLEGVGSTDATVVPPALLRPHDALVSGYPYDVAKARALLDGAGWRPGGDGVRQRDGSRLRLTLVSGAPSAETFRPVPEVLQAQLREVGIALDILERPDVASYQELIATGQADLYLERGTQNDADPAFLPVLLFYTGGSAEEADYQALFAPGERFDRLVERSLSEPDPAQVRRAVAEAMDLIVDQDAVVVPLAGIVEIYGAKPEVSGLAPHPSPSHVRWERVARDDR